MGDWNKLYRKVATRNLRHTCDDCQKQIHKGEVFYDHVCICPQDYDMPMAKFTYRRCAKCAYKHERKNERSKRCPHKIVCTSYYYIFGEAVMEPDYDYCRHCGEKIL
jgi:hypothetical protein